MKYTLEFLLLYIYSKTEIIGSNGIFDLNNKGSLAYYIRLFLLTSLNEEGSNLMGDKKKLFKEKRILFEYNYV